MFYGQCWKCGERWELGTASACKCPDEEPVKFAFRENNDSTEVLRVTPEGEFIWHEDADRMIEEGDFSQSPALPHILKVLRKQRHEQEPVKDWIASHNDICALLRQAHDALALTSYPPQRTKQEPVAFASHGVINWIADKQFQHKADLYTTPPQHESTCAECDKNQSDGWALYCVDCLREFYKHDPTNKRKWVGLTDEDIWEAYMESPVELDCSTDELYALSRTVEAKLKEKNNG